MVSPQVGADPGEVDHELSNWYRLPTLCMEPINSYVDCKVKVTVQYY